MDVVSVKIRGNVDMVSVDSSSNGSSSSSSSGRQK